LAYLESNKYDIGHTIKDTAREIKLFLMIEEKRRASNRTTNAIRKYG
jgi:hypothetical protein